MHEATLYLADKRHGPWVLLRLVVSLCSALHSFVHHSESSFYRLWLRSSDSHPQTNGILAAPQYLFTYFLSFTRFFYFIFLPLGRCLEITPPKPTKRRDKGDQVSLRTVEGFLFFSSYLLFFYFFFFFFPRPKLTYLPRVFSFHVRN